MQYQKYFSTAQTPQSQPIPGKAMVKNSAGGFGFGVDDWVRLDRFLILGGEGGTYYTGERELTVRNANAVAGCIAANGPRVVARVVEISEAGRAPKNDPALFVLAMCAGMGDARTRKAALESLPRVARIGTHLFNFLNYIQAFRGWGRGLRDGVSAWYNGKEVDELAYQLIKYRQRAGWTHRDALRKAHPIPADEAHSKLYNWVTQGATDGVPELIAAFVEMQAAESDKQAVTLLAKYSSLPWETIPTQFLTSPKVWEALLPNLPLTALVRNLGRMTSVGLIKPMSNAAGVVMGKLTNQEALRKARVHPIAMLVALRTYAQGSGMRGSLKWSPVSQVIDALDDGFYLSFGNVEPTGKRYMLALDVSGSMGWGQIAGMPLTPREGSAAMAMVTARVEPSHYIMAFSHKLQRVVISKKQRLDDVIMHISRIPMGGTDCALPMLAATEANIPIDAFVVYTDSETWYGRAHPIQALDAHRRKVNPSAKLIVVGMVSNGFSIANPDDAGMLDVVGFDTATPQLISDFVS